MHGERKPGDAAKRQFHSFALRPVAKAAVRPVVLSGQFASTLRRAPQTARIQSRSFGSLSAAIGKFMATTPAASSISSVSLPASLPVNDSVLGSALQTISAASAEHVAKVTSAAGDLPFHNIQRLAGVYDPSVVDEVMHHLVEVWTAVKIEELILNLHSTLGTPWWGTIMVSTILLRCITVPFVTLFLKHMSKGKIEKERIRALLDEMNSPTVSEERKLQVALQTQATFKDKGIPAIGDLIIPLGFPPLMLSYFAATYNLCLQEGWVV